MKFLRCLDVFPKFDVRFEQDARQRTVVGGLLSFACMTAIAVLVVGEVRYFLSTVDQHEMYVDPHIGGEMHITLNVTFPRVPCDLMTADAIDSFGEYAKDVIRSTRKMRVHADTLQPISEARGLVVEKRQSSTNADSGGAEGCPSCYGAEKNPGDCCNTCDDVRNAFKDKGWSFNEDDIGIAQCAEERLRHAESSSSREGCNIYAKFSASRVKGNIHFVPGSMFDYYGQHMHVLKGEIIRKMNLSHIIHQLDFGERFPGQKNPLDGMVNSRGVVDKSESTNGRFSYFVQVVPTQYQHVSIFGTGRLLETNQYSVTHYFTESWNATGRDKSANDAPSVVPGIFILYDISPIKTSVKATHPYPSVVHLVLQLCAVGGGVFNVASLIDSFLFHGTRQVQKKIRQGKYF
uniref:ERGIC and golgi family 3 n=1 Tax=Trypanosoma vivax (strain Y486) TaxID=1055687 RepID=G0TUY8_TRYVY|nr:conserved hypothetical protein [Trypanosoma vivax Y486]